MDRRSFLKAGFSAIAVGVTLSIADPLYQERQRNGFWICTFPVDVPDSTDTPGCLNIRSTFESSGFVSLDYFEFVGPYDFLGTRDTWRYRERLTDQLHPGDTLSTVFTVRWSPKTTYVPYLSPVTIRLHIRHGRSSGKPPLLLT